MKVFLKDDHDEALKIWRQLNIRNTDLVHIDAHIDFEVHLAQNPVEALMQAQNIKDLKKNLEYTLCFLKYEKTLDKQTDIGNYIYPAITEGIVQDFWWVVPGSAASLDKNKNILTNIFKNSFNSKNVELIREGKGMFLCRAMNRNFRVCTLDMLPEFKQPVLLDIDVDFMVVQDIAKADNTCEIGRRMVHVAPDRLKDILLRKIKNPCAVTIVYSTHGGFTPMDLRYLGDEMAYRLAPDKFLVKYTRAMTAAKHFRMFRKTFDGAAYRATIQLEPAYRGGDNNYGPLYLTKGKLCAAEKEFSRILKVDPVNYFALGNMGLLRLRQKKFQEAILFLEKALKKPKARTAAVLANALGEAKLKTGSLSCARRWFKYCLEKDPRNATAAFNLGETTLKENRPRSALHYYKKARQLGFSQRLTTRRIRSAATMLDR